MLANLTKKAVPHWLRRQIGSVLPSWRNHSRKDWTTETVRCVTADHILTEWATPASAAAARIDATNTKRLEEPSTS
jgi:hypothetical protein